METRICPYFKKLSSAVRRNIDQSDVYKNNKELTNVCGWTIGFIYWKNKNGEDVYQKDIEKEFNINRSTTCGLISKMEHDGFLVSFVSPNDKRQKCIKLTDKGIKFQEEIRQTMIGIDKMATKGFTEEELKTFESYLIRVKTNLDNERK